MTARPAASSSTSPLRSLLFVPGDSELKQDKALTLPADAIILDLEDAVAPKRRDFARQLVRARLHAAADRAGPQLWVRVNAPSGSEFPADLAAVVEAAPDGLVLPKVDGARQVIEVDRRLRLLERRAQLPGSAIRLIAIATETPQSMFTLQGYRDAGTRLVGLTWGSEDLTAALGASSKFEDDGTLAFTLRLARSLCVLAAAAARVQAIDGVNVDFRNTAVLQRDAAAARRDGFTGKLAIHPDQVEVINAAFTPAAAEIERAHAIVGAFEASPDAGVIGLDGCMLDRVHLLHAKRLLALAERLQATRADRGEQSV